MSEDIKKKKKVKRTVNEKIERLEEQLKKAKEEKKQSIQKKGINLWRKIKHIFLEEEDKIDILNNDKEKLDELKNDIKKSLNKLFNNKDSKENIDG